MSLIFRKMFKLIIISFIIVSCSSSYLVHKNEEGEVMVVGKLSWEQWQKSAGWESYLAKDYVPGPEVIQEISDAYQPEHHSFILFGGSWCGDSEDGIPVIYEILRLAGISSDAVTLYGVDRDKKEPSGTAAEMNIKKVPTLIILKDGKETDRIVESPAKSWEKDMLAAFRK